MGMTGKVKVEMLEIDKIKPYWRNPRKHTDKQIEALKKSIEKYGFTQPIVVDKDYTIIIGHGRYVAAKELGLKKVPVIVRRDLSEREARELRIIDNRIADLSDWDTELLRTEIMDLDIEELLGFTRDEIEKIIGIVEEHYGKISGDDVAEAEEKLMEKIAETQDDQIPVVCPACGTEFFVDRKLLAGDGDGE